MCDWYLEMGGNYIIGGKQVFGRNIFIPLEKVEATRSRFGNTDVYATVYVYDNPKQDESNLYGPLYIDLDLKMEGNDDYTKIKKDLTLVVTALNNNYKIPYEYIKIYFSGNKGFHVVVDPEVIGVIPSKKLNEYYKHIAEDLKSMTMFKTIDSRIYDNKRLFRLPNSINSKTGLYKVPVSYEFVRTSTYDQMKQYATEPHESDYPDPKIVRAAADAFKMAIKTQEEKADAYLKGRNKNVKFNKNKIAPCIQSIIEYGATSGQRNNTAVVLASSLLQKGMELDKVITAVLEWNREKVRPALPDREIINTVQSADKGIQEGKKYGCSAIINLGLCVPNKCKVRTVK